MHECQTILHLRCREHVDVLDPEGLEDVLLEIVIQGHARYSFDHVSCSVNTDLLYEL